MKMDGYIPGTLVSGYRYVQQLSVKNLDTAAATCRVLSFNTQTHLMKKGEIDGQIQSF